MLSCRNENENRIDPVSSPNDTTDTTEFAIRVTIRNSDENPIPNANVIIYPDRFSWFHEHGEYGIFKANGDGVLLLDTFSPDAYFLRIPDPQWNKADLLFGIDSFTGSGIQEVVIQLEKRYLLKRILRKDGGGPQNLFMEFEYQNGEANTIFRNGEKMEISLENSAYRNAIGQWDFSYTGPSPSPTFYDGTILEFGPDNTGIKYTGIGLANEGGEENLGHSFYLNSSGEIQKIIYGVGVLHHWQYGGEYHLSYQNLNPVLQTDEDAYDSTFMVFDQMENPFRLLGEKIWLFSGIYSEILWADLGFSAHFGFNVPFTLGTNNMLRQTHNHWAREVNVQYQYNSQDYPSESHYLIDSAGVILEDFTLYFEYEL